MKTKQNLVIKPCPFCGTMPKVIKNELNLFCGDYLVTHRKGCGFAIVAMYNKQLIYQRDVNAWNKRADK